MASLGERAELGVKNQLHLEFPGGSHWQAQQNTQLCPKGRAEDRFEVQLG
jgi:hypothetical protein